MVKIRLRTKFLVSLIFTTTALTFAVLYIVRSYLRNHARQEIHQALSNSVITFQHFEQQRQTTLAQSAGVMADLPSLRALMTTHHQPTIQDASTGFWKLAGCDLFLLADRIGKSNGASYFNHGVQSKCSTDLPLSHPAGRGDPGLVVRRWPPLRGVSATHLFRLGC